MNALWLSRIYAYKNNSLNLETTKQIIKLKIDREQHLAKKYKYQTREYEVHKILGLQDLMLLEARAAKESWRVFGLLIDYRYNFAGRVQHGSDIPNKLLDIGFHYLAGVVAKILQAHNIPTEVGLMHTAHKTTSTPLVYDIMEIFRADIVVAEVLSFLRLKKIPLAELKQENIGHFINSLNSRLEKKFYLEDFKQCHTYRYYIELQILRIISAVNHSTVFTPFILPTRHDTRCSDSQLDNIIK